MKNKRTIEIREDMVQEEAETLLGRELSSAEYEEVCNGIDADLSRVVQYEIDRVICLNDLIESSKGADTKFPQYKVFHRNENAFQSEFKIAITVAEEEDAKHFIEHQIVTEFDEWRVMCVDQDGTEKSVYTVNC